MNFPKYEVMVYYANGECEVIGMSKECNEEAANKYREWYEKGLERIYEKDGMRVPDGYRVNRIAFLEGREREVKGDFLFLG